MAKQGCRPAGASQEDTPLGIHRKRRVYAGELESFLLISLLAIFFPKPLDPSCSVQEFLFAREKRMAVGTDLHMDLLLSTLRLKGGPTGALDHGIKDFRVNILLHLLSLHTTILLISHRFSTFCWPIRPQLSATSPMALLLIHRIEKLPVAFGGTHLFQEKFHALYCVHRLEHPS